MMQRAIESISLFQFTERTGLTPTVGLAIRDADESYLPDPAHVVCLVERGFFKRGDVFEAIFFDHMSHLLNMSFGDPINVADVATDVCRRAWFVAARSALGFSKQEFIRQCADFVEDLPPDTPNLGDLRHWCSPRRRKAFAGFLGRVEKGEWGFEANTRDAHRLSVIMQYLAQHGYPYLPETLGDVSSS
jgi:hypothetical protein